jgi:hypothetical protein
MISPLRVCLSVCLLSVCVARADATAYYVSAAGNDANAGTLSAPWRTLARVNAVTLQPGDSVMLRGGDRFPGGLSFDSADAGTTSAPIAITSYGAGRATIAAAGAPGVSVYNAAGYRLSNLTVVGNGSATTGIIFYADLPGGVKLPYVRIDAVDVGGFGRNGIEIGSWNGATGYRDVQITNATAHDNTLTGIVVYAQQPNVHESIYIGGARAFNNPGLAGTTTNSGSGIVLGSVNGATIERSVAHSNGWRCTAPEGPVGIWAYDSTNVIIQHNESYGNRTGGKVDGGGFDLDQNVSLSTVQYNYSHDNDGAGYLLAHAPANDNHRGNVVRFNISENDGRKNSYAAIELWGRIVATEIYNNTVFLSPSTSGLPRAVRVGNASITDRDVSGVHLRNNILQTTGGLPLVEVTTGQLAGAADLRFQGNDYFSATGFAVRWGSTTYSSLAAWRTAGQEMNGSTAVGRTDDPMLTAPGAGGTLDDATRLETLDAYRLKAGSPLVDAGLNLASMFAIDSAGADFYATVLAGAPDIGAHEVRSTAASTTDIVLYALHATTIAGAWAPVSDPTAAGATRLRHRDAGAPKLSTPLAAPANYFELTFAADAGTGYRLWIRGKADADNWANDSVYVQFSDSIDANRVTQWRIGTTSAAAITIEDCSGCGLSGWGWQDNGYGVAVLGPLVYFAQSGMHTVRIQTREDGVSIDQVVLSSRTYRVTAPGALRNDTTILPLTTTVPTATATDILIYSSDIPASGILGDWTRVDDVTAAHGVSLKNANRGVAKILAPLATPVSHVDVPFQALAGVPYHLWVRLRASGNAAGNDSLYVQFSGAVDASGAPRYRIGTTTGGAVILQDFSGAPISGWGWNDDGWASTAPPLYFATSGPQTLRLQPREDGVFVDQIVLSPGRYLYTSPGALTNDTTILNR